MSMREKAGAIWRGTAARTARTPEDEGARGRILLLLPPGSNRNLLHRHLCDQYDVVEVDNDTFPEEPFDLAIVDAASFRHWYTQLTDAKEREEPTFLPVILTLSRNDLRHRLRAFWDVVDEFAVTPIDRNELSERVAMLLRARRMAVAQRSRLVYLVNHDRATGLPSKSLFMDRLTNVLRDASLLNWKVATAVVHIPLSRILKSLGHQGLESAALACSRRLRNLLGDDVSLARLSTEEWGIIHHSRDSIDSIIEVCARAQKLSEKPIKIGDELVHVSPRIGIAVYPDDATSAASLLDCAVSALSEARTSRPMFYSPEVQRHALKIIRTEARLHEALEKKQLELWYQPQVNLLNGDIIGVEALVRWRLPGGELVPPMEFIPVAEAVGLVRYIDQWVLEEACRVMQRWSANGVGVPRVAVNVSADDINAADFAKNIHAMLNRYTLPPPSLELEITESSLFEISDENLEKLNSLRESGVSIAVDDFGTGYSSLSYLHRLPINVLKIDKSFVDRVDTDKTHEAVASTIVWLAGNFGLETVAEGIETEQQAEKLRSMRVTTGQGYLYARPMPENELLGWLSNHVRVASAAVRK